MGPEVTSSPRQRNKVGFWLRLIATCAAIALLVRFVDLEDLRSAFGRIHLGSMVACFFAVLVGQLAGVARFQLLLDAYGAQRKPPLVESTRLFFVAAFYNTYLPGAVAGDVLRAVAIRSCFSEGGVTSALALSFVERVVGVAGMLVLILGVTSVWPVPGISGIAPLSAIGLVLCGVAIYAVGLGRRASTLLPARVRRLALGLPDLRAPSAFFGVFASAVFTHACTALGFHAIMRSLTDRASLSESMVVVPLACSAAYVPATIAGAGTRDAAFVFLYEKVGVAAADSLAMSIAALLCTLLVAGIGGVANFFGPFGEYAP